jgi:hypothetical protein
VIFPGFTLEHRDDGPLLQLARLALIVAALSRCGGPRMTRALSLSWPGGPELVL